MVKRDTTRWNRELDLLGWTMALIASLFRLRWFLSELSVAMRWLSLWLPGSGLPWVSFTFTGWAAGAERCGVNVLYRVQLLPRERSSQHGLWARVLKNACGDALATLEKFWAAVAADVQPVVCRRDGWTWSEAICHCA